MDSRRDSHNREPVPPNAVNFSNPVIASLISGSISSALTTIVYQPLDLLKTRIQLRDTSVKTADGKDIATIGRATRSAFKLVKTRGFLCLWQGTGASLMRSVPGVGLYYATLNVLQTNYSSQDHLPNDAAQAFYFGLIARTMISFVLLPVTVVKVRYESGIFHYPTLINAVKSAYLSSNGWAGLVPTVLRDSLFSGTYYMLYTQLKVHHKGVSSTDDRLQYHLRLFSYGVISGLVASFLTNPIDVVKTRVQARSHDSTTSKPTVRQAVRELVAGTDGILRFFDGLGLRSVRRTLIAASTWTFYELLIDLMHQ